MNQEREKRQLQEALKVYFLDGDQGLEPVYERLCAVEKNAIEETYPEEDFYPHFAARTAVCKELLGNTPIYELFPEEDFRGTFEDDLCDDMVWQERYYFAKPVHGMPDTWEVDRQGALYQAYRQILYQKTIVQICEKYPQELLRELSQDERNRIKELVRKVEKKEQELQPDFASFQKEKQGVLEMGAGKIEARSKDG